MAKYGRQAKIVSVYFNGHGESEEGEENARLSFHEPMRQDENLDTVLRDLNAILQKSNTDELPLMFNVVFCQCYGHKYHDGGSYDLRMRVRPLSSDIPEHCKAKWLEYKKRREEEEKEKEKEGKKKQKIGENMGTTSSYYTATKNILDKTLRMKQSYHIQMYRQVAVPAEARETFHRKLEEMREGNLEVPPKPTDFLPDKPGDE